MPLGIHNPLPSSMRSECKKAGKILESFTSPSSRMIPSRVLANAKGLVICTVTRAGFLGSLRFGSGILVARLPDGSWSAPSAIATVGGGFGGLIGLELTDFVFILNDDHAVRTFSQAGSLTLGGNVSVALGPVGRSAEVSAGASTKGVASMFAYSKTKGLFGGISLEGNMLVERSSANRKLYDRELTARQLLSGEVPPPSEAEALMRVLQSEAFQPKGSRPPLNPPASGGAELPAASPVSPVGSQAAASGQSISELPDTPSGAPPHPAGFELHGESRPVLPAELPAELPAAPGPGTAVSQPAAGVGADGVAR
ncbi:hypothetical protein HFD88_004766 [Aspergillus terreus]|nr:hypothetical protein HFD88_004766 [Aspergillus terreus]